MTPAREDVNILIQEFILDTPYFVSSYDGDNHAAFEALYALIAKAIDLGRDQALEDQINGC